MGSTSRVLRKDETANISAVWWVDHSPKQSAPPPRREPAPKPAAAPASELDRERVEREAYQRGFSEGSSIAKQQAAAEQKPVLERLSQCLAELSSLRSGLRRQAETDVVKLSVAIARRVLHRELTLDPESIAALIRVALDKLESRDLCRVRVHPDQEPILRGLLERFSGSKVELLSDAALNKGDVLLETANGTVDASVDAQLREIERGLADRLQS